MSSVATIGDLTNALTPDVGDGGKIEIEDAAGDSAFIYLSQLRVVLGQLLLTGDVTATGYPGSTMATTIAALAVTLAKMADGTADRLIGYDASGHAAQISAGSGVTISAGVISASAPAASAPRATLYLAENYAL